ncbi:hypothetical protein [Acinetobacter guillouiae]|uniref:hypothetical protein n=1 Tax=Acinetobacter guillouiae TaxID=106649 RepID=UPI0003A323D2|nr:hypothetical protein [Acinetobacter guillouiae]
MFKIKYLGLIISSLISFQAYANAQPSPFQWETEDGLKQLKLGVLSEPIIVMSDGKAPIMASFCWIMPV